ncbi:MAG: hypothetical protein ABSG89_00690 [Bacteroidales bacterium]|jgi:hypothetical protein
MKHIVQSEIDILKAKRAKGDYIDTLTLKERIKERRFTVKDIGVAYRWIDHWYSKGLLLGSYKEGKWRKFNLIEYVWLKMIIKMRQFNIGLDIVKSVKDMLDFDFTFDDFKKIDGINMMDIIPKIAPSDLESEAKEILKDKEVQENIKQTHMNLLGFFIMDILLLGNCYSILINPDGAIIPVKYSFLELISDIPEFKNLIYRSFISISITEILRDYIIEKDLIINNTKRLALLTDEETIVLKTIRQDDLKSVIIRFDKDKKMNLLEEVREIKIDGAIRLTELIMAKGYQDITIKTQNGEIVYCENKRKQLIQKKA